ncbi:MAG: hypothetical protein QM538_02440 [Methylacidiphilales bacterium]|nr:hypothetical protein [Candidatus Methylacidiphilales bacterium]
MRVLLALIISCFAITQVHADEYYDKHFSGQFNFNYGGIGDSTGNYRQNGNLRFKWQDDFNQSGFALGIELYGFSSKIRYISNNTYHAYTFDPQGDRKKYPNGNYAIQTETRQEGFIYAKETLRTNEFYLKANGDIVEFVLGKEKLAWGQFDLFSPVDLNLPFDFSDTSLKLTKVENRLPLTHMRLSLYPNESTELSIYYFPDIERDEITSALDGDITFTRYNITDTNISGSAAKTASSSDTSIVQKKLKLKGREQAAFRMVFRDTVTVGITYFQGFWGFSANELRTIVEGIPLNNVAGGTTIGNTPIYQTELKKDYNEVRTLGIELAVPVDDNSTFKAELLYFLDPVFSGDIDLPQCASLNQFVQYNNSDRYKGCSLSVIGGVSQRDVDTLNFITSANKNRLYLESNFTIFALGVDYLSEDWNVFFSMFGFFYQHSKEAKRAEQLGAELNDAIIGPSLVAKYTFGQQRDHSTTFVLGSIGVAAGISIAYNYQMAEGAIFILGFEAIQFSGDNSLISNVTDNFDKNKYLGVDAELNTDLTIALRTGFQVSF